MANGETGLPPRRFAKCHRLDGNELLIDVLLIDVERIVAAEEIGHRIMRVYCEEGHVFDISEHDYDHVEKVILEARDQRIV